MFPPEKLKRYPHLMVSDIRIWEHFLETVHHGFDGFDYDVHVGEGIKVEPEWDPEIKRMAVSLSEKRIDVVGWKLDVPTIIEVKPAASMSAIGQVMSYRELYIKRFVKTITPLTLIVTDREIPDIKFLCSRFGIRLVVVG